MAGEEFKVQKGQESNFFFNNTVNPGTLSAMLDSGNLFLDSDSEKRTLFGVPYYEITEENETTTVNNLVPFSYLFNQNSDITLLTNKTLLFFIDVKILNGYYYGYQTEYPLLYNYSDLENSTQIIPRGLNLMIYTSDPNNNSSKCLYFYNLPTYSLSLPLIGSGISIGNEASLYYTSYYTPTNYQNNYPAIEMNIGQYTGYFLSISATKGIEIITDKNSSNNRGLLQMDDGRLTINFANIEFSNVRLQQVADPVEAQDAATKNYVDNLINNFSSNDSINIYESEVDTKSTGSAFLSITINGFSEDKSLLFQLKAKMGGQADSPVFDSVSIITINGKDYDIVAASNNGFTDSGINASIEESCLFFYDPVIKKCVILDKIAVSINLGTIYPSKGGTGRTSLTKDSFVVGNGINAVQLLTPAQAADKIKPSLTSIFMPKTGGTFTGEISGPSAQSLYYIQDNQYPIAKNALRFIDAEHLYEVNEENGQYQLVADSEFNNGVLTGGSGAIQDFINRGKSIAIHFNIDAFTLQDFFDNGTLYINIGNYGQTFDISGFCTNRGIITLAYDGVANTYVPSISEYTTDQLNAPLFKKDYTYVFFYENNLMTGYICLSDVLPPRSFDITVAPSAVTATGTAINIAKAGIKADMRTRTELKIPDNVTADNFKALQTAYSCLDRVVTKDDSVDLYFYNTKPTTEFTIRITEEK